MSLTRPNEHMTGTVIPRYTGPNQLLTLQNIIDAGVTIEVPPNGEPDHMYVEVHEDFNTEIRKLLTQLNKPMPPTMTIIESVNITTH